MDWGRHPPNGFDETTHTLCWDGDTSGNQDEEGLVRLLREHAGVSLWHLHVRCGCLLRLCCVLIQLMIVNDLKWSRFSTIPIISDESLESGCMNNATRAALV